MGQVMKISTLPTFSKHKLKNTGSCSAAVIGTNVFILHARFPKWRLASVSVPVSVLRLIHVERCEGLKRKPRGSKHRRKAGRRRARGQVLLVLGMVRGLVNHS